MHMFIGQQLAAPFQGHPDPKGDLPSLKAEMRDHNQTIARLRYKLCAAFDQFDVPKAVQADILDSAQLWYCFSLGSQTEIAGDDLNVIYQKFDPKIH